MFDFGMHIYKSLDISEGVREWESGGMSRGVRNDVGLYLAYVYIYTSLS